MSERESKARHPFLITVGLAGVLNAMLWVVALWLLPQEGPATTLHYNATPPIVGLIILIGNVFLAFLLRKISKRASAVLCAAALVVQGLLILSFLALWRLNQ